MLSHRGRTQSTIMFSSIIICGGLWRQLYFMHVASLTVYMDNISAAMEHSAHLPYGLLMDHITILAFVV